MSHNEQETRFFLIDPLLRDKGYGEFDRNTHLQTGPLPLADFPTHTDLSTRYAQDNGIDLDGPEAAVLFQADSPATSAIAPPGANGPRCSGATPRPSTSA